MDMSFETWAEKHQDLMAETNSYDFYRDLFPTDTFIIFKDDDGTVFSSYGVILEKTKDSWEKYRITDDLDAFKYNWDKNNFYLISPIRYAGDGIDQSATNTTEKEARYIYSLTINISDNINNLDDILNNIQNGSLPAPTYIVHSHPKIQIYYLLSKVNGPEQIDLRKEKRKLIQLHDVLTRLWSEATGGDAYYENLYAAYSVIGTVCHRDSKDTKETAVVAYKFKDGAHWKIDNLIAELPNEDKKNFAIFKASDNEIAEKKKSTKKRPWCKPANPKLYQWWIKQVADNAQYGYRYWAIFALAIYAVKCDIPYKELKDDAYKLQKILSDRGPDPFTIEDTNAALKAYNKKYIYVSADYIRKVTGIHFKKNKRSEQPVSRSEKLKEARVKLKELYPNGEWRNKNGAPTKKEDVKKWRIEHPNGTKAECIKETKFSKNTVKKWWDATD